MYKIEIGGYIEIEHYRGKLLHENAIALNSARNCLAYLIEARQIKKIALPKFLCNSVEKVCVKYGLKIRHYSVGEDFYPKDYEEKQDEWLYLVNYYGQIDNEKIKEIKVKYHKIIVDNVQAYFQRPVEHTDTIYTCRKYFGVPDGAFLYTEANISRELEQDKSADRMEHLLGRFENTASDYYLQYRKNETLMDNLPLKRMSLLTKNLLQAVDYENVKKRREQNYRLLDEELSHVNGLTIKIPHGPFMYPFYVPNGDEIRKDLQNQQIYIPTLWPDVFDICSKDELEYNWAKNILPLPCDQRYELSDMMRMANTILKLIRKETEK